MRLIQFVRRSDPAGPASERHGEIAKSVCSKTRYRCACVGRSPAAIYADLSQGHRHPFEIEAHFKTNLHPVGLKYESFLVLKLRYSGAADYRKPPARCAISARDVFRTAQTVDHAIHLAAAKTNHTDADATHSDLAHSAGE